jgi:hypothetical protein
MAVPTFGWRTLKAVGTRLMRDENDESLSVQTRESYSGPTKGYIFIRVYSETDDHKGYTIIALNEKRDIAAIANGEKNAQTWDHIHAALRAKGVNSQPEPGQ